MAIERSALRMRNSVVFPAPDGPMTDTNSPGSTPKETSVSTCGLLPKRLLMCAASSSMDLLSGRLEHGLRVTLAVIVRILAPGIADLAEDADDLLALVGLGDLDERLAERLAEILVGHEVGVLAVGDHVIVDALGHTDDARLLDHGGRAAELLLPDGRVLDADMAIGDHHVSLTGGQTRERRAVRVGLHHVIQIGNGLALMRMAVMKMH